MIYLLPHDHHTSVMGYNVKFFDPDVDPVFICSRCNGILEDPILCENTGCHGMVCYKCTYKMSRTARSASTTTKGVFKLQSRKKIELPCPICQETFVLDHELLRPHWEFSYRLDNLEMRCVRDCGSMTCLGKLSAHFEAECSLTRIQCPNKPMGCKVDILRRDLKEHSEELCRYRKIACEVCGFRTTYNRLISHQKVKRCFEIKLMNEKVRSVIDATRCIKDHQKAVRQQAASIGYQIMKSRARRFEELCGRSSNTRRSASGRSAEEQDSREQMSRMTNSSSPDNSSRSISRVSFTSQSLSPAGSSRPVSSAGSFSTVDMARKRRQEKLQCQRCGMKYRERDNDDRACCWHRGVSNWTMSLSRDVISLNYYKQCTFHFVTVEYWRMMSWDVKECHTVTVKFRVYVLASYASVKN